MSKGCISGQWCCHENSTLMNKVGFPKLVTAGSASAENTAFGQHSSKSQNCDNKSFSFEFILMCRQRDHQAEAWARHLRAARVAAVWLTPDLPVESEQVKRSIRYYIIVFAVNQSKPSHQRFSHSCYKLQFHSWIISLSSVSMTKVIIQKKLISLLKYALLLWHQNNQKVLVDKIYCAYHYTPFSYLGHIRLLYQKRLNIVSEIIAMCPH